MIFTQAQVDKLVNDCKDENFVKDLKNIIADYGNGSLSLSAM